MFSEVVPAKVPLSEAHDRYMPAFSPFSLTSHPRKMVAVACTGSWEPGHELQSNFPIRQPLEDVLVLGQVPMPCPFSERPISSHRAGFAD